MNIDVKALPDKLKEFLQTLDSLMIELRQAKGNFLRDKVEIIKLIKEV
jgi:hypothetical protein